MIYFDKETRSFSITSKDYIGIGIGSGLGALGGGLYGYDNAKYHADQSGFDPRSSEYKKLMRKKIAQGAILGGAAGGLVGFGGARWISELDKKKLRLQKEKKLNSLKLRYISRKKVKIDKQMDQVSERIDNIRKDLESKFGVSLSKIRGNHKTLKRMTLGDLMDLSEAKSYMDKKNQS